MDPSVTLETVKRLIQSKRLEEASEACRRLIDATGDKEAIYLLAVVTSHMGLFGESLTLFEKALKELPPRSDVFYNYGIVL